MKKHHKLLLQAVADLITMAIQYAGYRLAMFLIMLLCVTPLAAVIATAMINIVYLLYMLSPWSTRLFDRMRDRVIDLYTRWRFRPRMQDGTIVYQAFVI